MSADAELHPAMTRIIAIRHGETAWNAQHRLQGQLDVGLNAVGRAQAAAVAQALREEPVQAIVASDLARAHDTALAVARGRNITVQQDPMLRERHFGTSMQGLTYAEIDARHPMLSQRWRERDPDFVPPGGGESLAAFRQRSVQALAHWAGRCRGGTLVVVTHGGVLDALYREATGIALNAPRHWTIGNTAIQRLLHGEQGFRLLAWDDQRHLQGLNVARDEAST